MPLGGPHGAFGPLRYESLGKVRLTPPSARPGAQLGLRDPSFVTSLFSIGGRCSLAVDKVAAIPTLWWGRGSPLEVFGDFSFERSETLICLSKAVVARCFVSAQSSVSPTMNGGKGHGPLKAAIWVLASDSPVRMPDLLAKAVVTEWQTQRP
jgi:hypothetical protein